METALHRLLGHAQRLVTLANPEEILAVSSREAIEMTGAHRVLASCCVPGQAWEHGVHIEASPTSIEPVTVEVRSAMFAIHRRLSKERRVLELARTDDHAVIHEGLRCGPEETLCAVPMIHRTGRLWGELVLIGAAPFEGTAELGTLAQLATAALENAQRLAFARRDQERLMLLAEATDDALYDWNFDQRDFWWGGGILDLLGSDADPVENTARWKLERIHPDDAERVRASLDGARFSKTTTWHAEYRFRRHDDTYIHVEDRGYFLRDTAGRAYRMIGAMRDMTQIKDLLAREQQARAEAENANRAKDEFLAMLGHELRNPLAPIVTGLQLVRMRGGAGIERELTVLERQAQHLVRLVDDLLDISRIAHKKIELKTECLEVASAIDAAIETAGPLIESRMHQLRVDVPESGLEVVADRARLAQSIANLLTNAAKYTPSGGKIEIRARRDARTVKITVRDSGIGIEPEMLPKVFHMFVQERQALDRAQGGLGLGLSIVRSLIELHGGSVAAASGGRGKGSEFTIELPAANPRAEAGPQKPPARRAPRVTGRKIMVVDDNEDAADLLSALLERLGNTTRVAHDANAALRLADEFEPDLAVLDIGLPDVDGYELARRLREKPDPDLRLIALTGYGQASDRERAVEAGFDAHLVKPIALDALEAIIERLVSRSS